jgi:hypothetical protein
MGSKTLINILIPALLHIQGKKQLTKQVEHSTTQATQF